MHKRIAAILGLLVLLGCSGDSGGPTGTGGIASVKMVVTAINIIRGQTEQLGATAVDANGNVVAGAPAPTWSSSNTAIATVTQAGVVAAVANGQADISATISGKTGTTRVTVGPAPLNATVQMPGLTFSPFTTTIRVTGTVAFVFPPLAHNVIFKPGVANAPADILVTANATVNRTFNSSGNFAYDCTLHPGMAGEVIVVP